jgi:hypothetical protein
MINPHGMSQIVTGLLFMLGVIMPLIGTGMIPRGSQRMGGAVFALMGMGVIFGIGGYGSTPISLGIGVGLMLGSAKLITGISFL